MEKRNENVEESNQGGQTVMGIKLVEFENDFLKQSIEGLKVVDSKGAIRRDVPFNEIINELNKSQIKELHYIEDQLAVKVIYTDGKHDVFYRE